VCPRLVTGQGSGSVCDGSGRGRGYGVLVAVVEMVVREFKEAD
jgi:hypothetical protein